jgi:hypothetical protein
MGVGGAAKGLLQGQEPPKLEAVLLEEGTAVEITCAAAAAGIFRCSNSISTGWSHPSWRLHFLRRIQRKLPWCCLWEASLQCSSSSSVRWLSVHCGSHQMLLLLLLCSVSE